MTLQDKFLELNKLSMEIHEEVTKLQLVALLSRETTTPDEDTSRLEYHRSRHYKILKEKVRCLTEDIEIRNECIHRLEKENRNLQETESYLLKQIQTREKTDLLTTSRIKCLQAEVQDLRKLNSALEETNNTRDNDILHLQMENRNLKNAESRLLKLHHEMKTAYERAFER